MQINIYVLIDPNTLRVMYVGQTKRNIKKRFIEHISKAKNGNHTDKFNQWIKSLLDNNQLPIIELVEQCNESFRVSREQYWISHYSCILNQTKGGEFNSEEGLLIVSSKLKGRHRDEQTRQKISQGHIGKILSNETKQKLREHNLGKKQSLEQRFKTSRGGVVQYSKNMEFIKEYPTLGEVLKEYPNMSKGTLSTACTGRLKTYYGFIWKYKKDIV